MKEEYMKLLNTGMFWEFYPELTGVWEEDKEKWMEISIQKAGSIPSNKIRISIIAERVDFTDKPIRRDIILMETGDSGTPVIDIEWGDEQSTLPSLDEKELISQLQNIVDQLKNITDYGTHPDDPDSSSEDTD